MPQQIVVISVHTLLMRMIFIRRSDS